MKSETVLREELDKLIALRRQAVMQDQAAKAHLATAIGTLQWVLSEPVVLSPMQLATVAFAKSSDRDD